MNNYEGMYNYNYMSIVLVRLVAKQKIIREITCSFYLVSSGKRCVSEWMLFEVNSDPVPVLSYANSVCGS